MESACNRKGRFEKWGCYTAEKNNIINSGGPKVAHSLTNPYSDYVFESSILSFGNIDGIIRDLALMPGPFFFARSASPRPLIRNLR